MFGALSNILISRCKNISANWTMRICLSLLSQLQAGGLASCLMVQHRLKGGNSSHGQTHEYMCFINNAVFTNKLRATETNCTIVHEAYECASNATFFNIMCFTPVEMTSKFHEKRVRLICPKWWHPEVTCYM